MRNLAVTVDEPQIGELLLDLVDDDEFWDSQTRARALRLSLAGRSEGPGVSTRSRTPDQAEPLSPRAAGVGDGEVIESMRILEECSSTTTG